MRISYDDMVREFTRVLEKYGITGEDAVTSAHLFADASRDGVHTHGLNRFPKFIQSIKNGIVDVTKRAELAESYGALERWDGQRGPGNLNALIATKRALELSKEHTVGVVGLRNTNHWMRPGNYGIYAAEHGNIAILWTNTIPNMPPWGGKDAKLGNNPLVMAIPFEDDVVLVDVAMSMFSYGKLEKLKREGKMTPVDGGLDRDGNVTRDPAKLLETHQVFPMGYWKGSSLSLAIDLIAAVVSGGDTTKMVGDEVAETNLSQFFLTIDLSHFSDRAEIDRKIRMTLDDLKSSEALDPSSPVRFPGEGAKRIREESMREGVWVDEGIWKSVLEL